MTDTQDSFETLVAEGHVTPPTMPSILPAAPGSRPTLDVLEEIREDRG